MAKHIKRKAAVKVAQDGTDEWEMKELAAKKITVPKKIRRVQVTGEYIFKLDSENWIISDLIAWRDVEVGGEVQELNVTLKKINMKKPDDA